MHLITYTPQSLYLSSTAFLYFTLILLSRTVPWSGLPQRLIDGQVHNYCTWAAACRALAYGTMFQTNEGPRLSHSWLQVSNQYVTFCTVALHSAPAANGHCTCGATYTTCMHPPGFILVIPKMMIDCKPQAANHQFQSTWKVCSIQGPKLSCATKLSHCCLGFVIVPYDRPTGLLTLWC